MIFICYFFNATRASFRIRPQLTREKLEMCKICTNVTPGEPQVNLGKISLLENGETIYFKVALLVYNNNKTKTGHKEDKSFTFDYVFDQESSQEEIYAKCVHDLVEACFGGYNATVLAYGQTGSGKTYTMGTAFDTMGDDTSPSAEVGLIPRAIAHIFERIEQMTASEVAVGSAWPKFTVLVQFMELYNEEINDLFAALPTTSTSTNTTTTTTLLASSLDTAVLFQTAEQYVFNKTASKARIEIHEDQAGGINVQGCSLHEVKSASEV